MAKAPELRFQQHIAEFLVRVHGYAPLEQSEISDGEHFIAEDRLWVFLQATQADTLKKLAEDYGSDARGEVFKALYAFSDFTHPSTNAAISEHAVNGLKDGELIEQRFEGDDYRLMIVANKFQIGFDQPLLAGMFLDKPVQGCNAVQTVSRLNRCHDDKDRVVVVDFTNNTKAILKAFVKYRNGTPFDADEPDAQIALTLYAEIIAAGVFAQQDAAELLGLIAKGSDAQVQYFVATLRERFQENLGDLESRKGYVTLLACFVKNFHFLSCFFTFSAQIIEFAAFAEYVGPQLIKAGGVSELMKLIRQTEVVKANVEFVGIESGGGTVTLRPGAGNHGDGPPPSKASIHDMIAQIALKYVILDDEALYIKEVTVEKTADPVIERTVLAHRDDGIYLDGAYRRQVNGEIQAAYGARGLYEELSDLKYTDTGGIFGIMAVTVIRHHLPWASA